jgi:uncharacterized Rmd1/YagE family protein
MNKNKFILLITLLLFSISIQEVNSFLKGPKKLSNSPIATSFARLMMMSRSSSSSSKPPPALSNDQVTRRKMGPPQRKRDAQESNIGYGRVAVYCVGSSIDIVSLRTHVFRRNFGTSNSFIAESGGRPELALSRGMAGIPEQLDDEVLHVSNAPLFISSNDSMISKVDALQWSYNNMERVEDLENPDYASDSGQDSDEIWKTREKLLLATQDIFYFDYGCVVFWGLTPREEKAALTELEAFTVEPVNPEELDNSFDTLQFVFDRKSNPQRPVKFDRMRLRSLQVEEKLALSYAMAQSSKLFVFESKVLQSVERSRYLPKELASKGRIQSSKKDLNQLIGQLFVQQTEVNLFSSILDTPDFLWDDDEYLPAYQYTRSYLEVDARVNLLNSRLSVIRDLLDVLNAQVADSNSTRLEWIIIWLISVEIIMGIFSNPLFTGKRVLSSLLVPAGIYFYKKVDWSVFFSLTD